MTVILRKRMNTHTLGVVMEQKRKKDRELVQFVGLGIG